MNDLQMLTQEEVAELLHAHVTTVSMLREVGILPAIKTGRNYMFSQQTIRDFQVNYSGYDVSNRVKALESLSNIDENMASGGNS
ncbi:MAG TPA: helix-turn-helix domain-containing protein [Candidatus Erysipelatoclostridium merdavium]|uniref:Helix-turn-helix domain-containing protein n=1 Tax=Candidatus Erysipelatoclostridium merdavium TaxID=2838566 RepID=A0A9D2BN43_9FIRM|nr:helix-turn-helix domain-containing protein [Candidatus Erysipelatoclostridium merdavium]